MRHARYDQLFLYIFRTRYSVKNAATNTDAAPTNDTRSSMPNRFSANATNPSPTNTGIPIIMYFTKEILFCFFNVWRFGCDEFAIALRLP